MKRVLTLLFVCVSLGLQAQDLGDLNLEDLKTAEDYRKVDPLALKCSEFVFASEIGKHEEDKKMCASFILVWMTGTADYSFEIGEDFVALTEIDESYGLLYLAAQANVALSEKETDPNVINEKALEKLFAYIESQEDGSKRMKKVRKKLNS